MSRTHVKLFTLIAAGVLYAVAAASTSARASEPIEHLGPVSAWEPILSGFGEKRIVAFYGPVDDSCAIQAVIWNNDDIDAKSASRIRISLSHGQTAHIDSIENVSLGLRCNGRLAIVWR